MASLHFEMSSGRATDFGWAVFFCHLAAFGASKAELAQIVISPSQNLLRNQLFLLASPDFESYFLQVFLIIDTEMIFEKSSSKSRMCVCSLYFVLESNVSGFWKFYSYKEL